MSKQAKALFTFFEKKKENEEFTLEDMSKASGYKIGSMRTKKNHCLINVYISEIDNKFKVIYPKVRSSNEKDFLKQISEKKENTTEKSTQDYLIENSKAFMLSAIELHNKPNFYYRYEIVTILIISAWEKLFKAHVLKFSLNKKEIEKLGIEKLIGRLKKITNPPIKNIKIVSKSIDFIKKFRNEIIHFYTEKDNTMIILNLIFRNIFLYCDYLKENFDIDIRKENDLYLFPIGLENYEQSFRKLMNEKHSNECFRNYLDEIKESIKDLKGEESIFIDINYSIEEKGSNTTKFVLANEGQKITISDEEIDKLYPYDYKELAKKLKEEIPEFKQNQKYHTIRKEIQDTKKKP